MYSRFNYKETDQPLSMGMGEHSVAEEYSLIRQLQDCFGRLSGIQQIGLQNTSSGDWQKEYEEYEYLAEDTIRNITKALLGFSWYERAELKKLNELSREAVKR